MRVLIQKWCKEALLIISCCVDAKSCAHEFMLGGTRQVITKLLYLINQGETFTKVRTMCRSCF